MSTDTDAADRQQHSPDAQDDPPPTATDTGETPDSEDTDQHDEPDDDDQDDDDGNVTGEARKYRKRAQKAERERDEARAQVEALQRSIVDGIAAAPRVGHPELLTAAGHELAEFITDDGTVDADKVRAAAAEAAQKYNIAPKGRPPQPNPQQGTGTGQPHGESSWSSALKGNR